MTVAVALWVFGALMALFFAWILGYMQRGDARIRTQRVMGLEERSVGRLVTGEVNAARGTLEAVDEPLASPIDGKPVLYVEAQLTREGTAGGKVLKMSDTDRAFVQEILNRELLSGNTLLT